MWIAVASAAEPPEPSVERGLYDAPFSVELRGGEGDTLYWSSDGSAPTLPYTGPIEVGGTSILRSIAVGPDGARSTTRTDTYLFVAEILSQPGMDPSIALDAVHGPVIEQNLRDLPTLSLVSPNPVSMVEQEVSVEWIPPEGETSQVDCGAEIIGGTSYVYDKSSLRLHFRSDYGAGAWEAELYEDDGATVVPVERFDALTLRSGNHDSVFYLGAAGQYTRNYWMDLSQLEQGWLAPHGRYFHLYFNGAYRGVYHLRERFDASFLAAYLGGDEEAYEAINGGSAFDGSGAAWASLVASASDFESARRWLNVENFLDYMVLNFYAANAWDWSPDHNWIAAGPTEADAGGFLFHSADSDICLYYGPETDILSNGGPSYLFYYLMQESHPDFRVALQDAVHRNLEDGGPLSAEAATDRYARIAAEAEAAMLTESARWGQGWWTRDEEWVQERDWLYEVFFAQRTTMLLDQMRAAGWIDLPAPSADTASGLVAPGTVVGISGDRGELWLSWSGDPREPGGAVAADATGPELDQAVELDRGGTLRARLRVGEAWGPLLEREWEVDEDPPILLNEWASGEDAVEDDALGEVATDWIELLVIEDHLDLRGWSLRLRDRVGEAEPLRFTDAELLADLRAGTLLTVATGLPEDPSYDPALGDWRFHLDPAGGAIVAGRLEVGTRDWQLAVHDAEDRLRVGWVGEGENPRAGLGSDEVGLLAETPGAGWRRRDAHYIDAESSSFGAPNRWEDGEQDLDGLRGLDASLPEGGDTGSPVATERREARCACASADARPLFLIALFLRRRRC